MAKISGRSVTQRLTHAGLVLAPQRGGAGWLGALVLAAGTAALGASGSYWYWHEQVQGAAQLPGVQHDYQALQQQLEQARLSLRMQQAQSQELEHQIDALNQRLRQCQEELTFFRKTPGGTH